MAKMFLISVLERRTLYEISLPFIAEAQTFLSAKERT